MTEADVCIVGGGIMGLATARALATASKLQILIVDRFGVGNEYCASNDSSRMFCFANGARERARVQVRPVGRQAAHGAGP